MVMLVQELLSMLANTMGTDVSSRVDTLLFTPAANAGTDKTDKHQSARVAMAPIALTDGTDRAMG